MAQPTRSSSSHPASKKTHPRKRRKIDHGESTVSLSDTTPFPRNHSSLPPIRREPDNPNQLIDLETTEVKNGESIAALRRMVLGHVEYKASQTAAGKYLALDCEMVGVGINGQESSLARVSIVNYMGAVILDAFVRQRERVVDYRTQWSGVRSSDLVGSAKPFKEVQETVADLIKDRVLVGHAVHNDLKALLLSHPHPLVRDTQSLAYKHRVVKSRRPALRVLVKQELDIVIQGGEHSSVTDARATMALFRLYRKQWESGFRSPHVLAQPRSNREAHADSELADMVTVPAESSSPSRHVPASKKRKRSNSSGFDDDDVGVAAEPPRACLSSTSSASHTQSPTKLSKRHPQGSRSHLPTDSGPRKGISSGIITVTRRAGGVKEMRRKGIKTEDGIGDKGGSRKTPKGGKNIGKAGERWWKSLGGGKGSIKG